MPHRGEEPVLSGVNGSGTVFFSHCNLRCVYCQNHQFSWEGKGEEVNSFQLADSFLELQDLGCHNLNLVTPTHVVPQIIEALILAIDKGFSLPIVYNTSGYDSLKTIQMLASIVDIYLPDMRYGDDAAAYTFSGCLDYVSINRQIIKEMFAQVGDLVTDNGVAISGLIVRHLVLPSLGESTHNVLKFIANDLSPDMPISLMRQYEPVHKACEHPVINRRITHAEYAYAESLLEKYGFKNGWIQDQIDTHERQEFLGEFFND